MFEGFISCCFFYVNGISTRFPLVLFGKNMVYTVTPARSYVHILQVLRAAMAATTAATLSVPAKDSIRFSM